MRNNGGVAAIADLIRIGEPGSDGLDYHVLDIGCRQAERPASLFRRFGRAVVSVSLGALDGMAGCQSPALLVKDLSGEQARALHTRSLHPLDRIGCKLRLNLFPEIDGNDRLVLSGMDLMLVADLAAIDWVPQDGVKDDQRRRADRRWRRCHRGQSAGWVEALF